MKNSILSKLVVTLGLSIAFGPVALMAQGEIRTTIPFDFTVGAKSFAAGRYTLQQVKENLFVIRDVHGHSGALAGTLPGEDSERPGLALLTFKRYGDSYFLSQVSDGNRNWQLYQSHAEKMLIAKSAPSGRVVVAAASPQK